MSIEACDVPGGTLLGRCRESGAWADCYATTIGRAVSLPEFVEAFYTTALFKVERRLLGWFVSRPSTDAQAAALAASTLDSFAAWRVEDRRPDEILLTDFLGRTRSWMKVEAVERGTRLYFGSAIGRRHDARSGEPTLGFPFNALLGFHALYSRALLRAARARLVRA